MITCASFFRHEQVANTTTRTTSTLGPTGVISLTGAPPPLPIPTVRTSRYEGPNVATKDRLRTVSRGTYKHAVNKEAKARYVRPPPICCARHPASCCMAGQACAPGSMMA